MLKVILTLTMPQTQSVFSYTTFDDKLVSSLTWLFFLRRIGDNIANFSVAISETGWPSDWRNPYMSKENALMYRWQGKPYVHLVRSGMPRAPDCLIYTLFFEMLNEDKKPAGEE